MERLTKTIEVLRSSRSAAQSGDSKAKKKDPSIVNKELISACHSVEDCLVLSTVKHNPDYNKNFSLAVEVLFTVCDDASADVRLAAEQCLNSVFRNLLIEGSATRVHVELYRELKRNGPSRSLRAALQRFGELASLIRPTKSRLFAVHLVSCVGAIARRPEEAVQEELGKSADKFWPILGRFFSDEESKQIIKSLLPNLQLQSAVGRRTASTVVVNVCRHSRKPRLFTQYLFRALLDFLVPIQSDQTASQILGSLLTIRQLWPLVQDHTDNVEREEVKLTDKKGSTIRLNPQTDVIIPVESLLQLFQVLMHHLCNPNSPVVAAALEALSQILSALPKELCKALSSKDGIGEDSRITGQRFFDRTLEKSGRSSSIGFGGRSGMNSLKGSFSDLTSTFAPGELGQMSEPPAMFDDRSQMTPEITIAQSENAGNVEDVIDRRVHVEDTASPYTALDFGVGGDDDNSEVASEVDDAEVQDTAVVLDPLRNLSLFGLDDAPDPLRMDSDALSPLQSPMCSVPEFSFPNTIGSLTDGAPALHYCARLLATKFLLAGRPGEVLSDQDVRVSHKSLALGCITSLVHIDPSIFSLRLNPNGDETSQALSDVLLFITHDDPQIRAAIASLAATLLASSFQHNLRVFADHELSGRLSSILLKALRDESAVCLRTSVDSARPAIVPLFSLDSGSCALDVIEQILNLCGNPYWLLKVSIVEFLSDLRYDKVRQIELRNQKSDKLQFRCFTSFVSSLLCDSDPRVRDAAATNLPNLVSAMCFGDADSWEFRPLKGEFLSNFVAPSMDKFPPVHNMRFPYGFVQDQHDAMVECSAAIAVTAIFQAFVTEPNADTLAGCVGGLMSLAEAFPPTSYRTMWSVSAVSMSDGAPIGTLEFLFNLLHASPVTSDVLAYQQTLNLAALIFAGHAQTRRSKALESSAVKKLDKWPLLGSPQLATFANDMTLHCIRIMNLYWHVLTDTTPTSNTTSVLSKQLPQLPQPPSLSPVRKALPGMKSDKGDTQTRTQPTKTNKLGDFQQSPVLAKLYDTLKGAHRNYQTSVDNQTTQRFAGLLKQCLSCFGRILEAATVADVGHHADEVLGYCKTTIDVLPEDTIDLVTQLLKALFGTNLALLNIDNFKPAAAFPSAQVEGLFQSCLVHSPTNFSHSLVALGNSDNVENQIKRHIGWLGSRADKHVVNAFKNSTTKTILTNYIRLFEPIVVQSLKLYTSSVTLSLQQSVLALLSQLVQDRVNYSLLDTDHRFLQFLYQQLDAIEQGTFRDAQIIVPTLFEFLLLLSYERSQDRQIVEMPKILQLCDSLVASGQNLDTIVIPALHPVVLDLFFVRPGVKVDPVKDIEMQQEVIASLLMKHLHNSRAMELLALVLWKTKKDGEETRWKRLSRDFVDRLLPALAKDQIHVDHLGLIDPYILGLKWSCPSAFRPADELLRTIFLVWNNEALRELIDGQQRPVGQIALDELVGRDELGQVVDPVLGERLEYTRPIYFARPLLIVVVGRVLAQYSKNLDIVRRFDNLSPCLFAALFLCKEEALLTRMDELHFDKSEPRSEVALAKLLFSVASGLSVEVLRRSSSSLDQSTPTENRLQWFLHLVCHAVQSSNLRKVAVEFASIVNDDGLDFLLEMHKIAPRLHIQWLTLLNAVRLFSDSLWLPNLTLEDRTTRHLVMLLYSDRLLILLNENEHDKVVEFFQRNAGDLVELSLELPILEFFRLAFQERDVAAKLADSIAQLLAIDTHPTFAKKVLGLLSQVGAVGATAVAPRLIAVGLRSDYAVVAKMAEQVLYLTLNKVVENDENTLTEETINQLASGFDLKTKLRHPLACAALRRLISARFDSLSSLSFDETWTIEERNDLTPSGPPNKFNRLKFIRLLQSAIRIGHAYSSRPIAEALAICTLEEMNEILSTEGVRPELLLACLRKVARLQSEAWLKVDESPTVECALSPLVMAVKASLFGNLHRIVKERVKVDFGEWCAPTSALLKMLAKQSMTSFLVEQDVSMLISFVDFCLKESVESGSWSIGGVTRVLRCAVVVLSSPIVNESLTIKKDGIRVQLSILASFQKIRSSVLMTRRSESSGADRKPLPFTLPEDVNSEMVQPFVDAWYTINSLLSVLETDSIAQVEPKKLRLALTDAIIVAARLPAVSSFARVPPAAFRFGWNPEAKWDGTCMSLPTTPVHHLQNVDVLRQFVWRLCWIGWTNRQVFEEVWMALLGVLSATPIGDELTANQSQSQQDVTERVMSSALAVNCLTALLLQNLMSPQTGNPLVSEYVIKHRDKPSSFLQTKNGRRLAALKARIIGRSDPATVFRQNLDRAMNEGATFSFGQISVDSIWGLTGVLAEERTMVGQKTTTVGEESPADDTEDDDGDDGLLRMPKSTSSFVLSTINNHDLVGYVRTLLDLYQHWLREGADAVPIALLSATVESLVVMSDLFADTDTYRWLRRLLKTVYGARSGEDELLLQWLLFGLLKCTAVVGLEETDGTKEVQSLVEIGLNSPQMAVRLFAVHGVLYLLQSLGDDELLPLMPAISDFVSGELDAALTLTDSSALINRPQSFAYRAALWTVAFFLVENCSDPYSRQNFVAKFMEQCSRALTSQTTPIPLLATIVGGMESLLMSSPAPEIKSAQISRLATGCLQRPPLSPQHTRAALQLLITCLYTGIERRIDHTSTDSADPQLSAMEQLTYLFNKVSSGAQMEADAVAEALPYFLVDNFNPGDVMNRVLSELLAVSQQRPRVLLAVIAQLFNALWDREAPLVVGDWALLSLPTFTHKSPATFAVWSLMVFLSCASSNDWIGALYPLLLDRSSDGTELDDATMVFLIKSLRDQLQEKTQLESLRLSLRDAAQRHGPQSPFSSAASALES